MVSQCPLNSKPIIILHKYLIKMVQVTTLMDLEHFSNHFCSIRSISKQLNNLLILFSIRTMVVIMEVDITEVDIMDTFLHIMEVGIIAMSILIMEEVITEVVIMKSIAISIIAEKSLCFSSSSSL